MNFIKIKKILALLLVPIFIFLAIYSFTIWINEIIFSDIMVLDKGQGYGKKILKNIVDTADELAYTITLDAKPFGNDAKGLDIKGLVYFYYQ
jgi:hypothetical protein